MKTWTSVFGVMALAVGVVFAGAACGDDSGGGKTVVAATPTASKPAATPTAAKAAKAAISVEGAWARKSPVQGAMTPQGQAGAMMPGDRGAAYLVIKNSGNADDALIGAESTIANATEVHESVMTGDVVTMRPVARIDVKASSSVELKPGGYHIMFIGLKQPLQVGTKVALTLKFEKAGLVQVEAEVREQ